MRSFILVVVTLFVLTMGYLAYWWTQSGPSRHGPVAEPSATTRTYDMQPGGKNGPIGQTEDGWLQMFDSHGEVASQYKYDRCDPQRDGRYRVQKAVAEFFLKDDQRLRIDGATGLISMPAAPSGPTPLGQKQPQQAPTRGELKDVQVTLWDDRTACPEANRLLLTIYLDNASFINERLQIFTEYYVDGSGVVVPKDQVPVRMIGQDYDFYGRGLNILWNERDNRLQSLEIAHGDHLVVKHPGKFTGANGTPSAPPTPTSMPASQMTALAPAQLLLAPARGIICPIPMYAGGRKEGGYWDSSPVGGPVRLLGLAGPVPIMLAADVPSSRPARTGEHHRSHQPSPSSLPSQPAEEIHVYRATFLDKVRIVQGEEQLVTADEMAVDFPMGSQKSPATQPADSSATQPAADATAHDGGVGGQPSDQAHRAHVSEPAPAATEPATQPAETPLIVYWTGKLIVKPSPTPEMIAQGDSIVSFKGGPVVARQQGSEISCAVLSYHSQDRSVYAREGREGQNIPLVMTMLDARGKSVIHTGALAFTQPKELLQRCRLEGPSTAIMPNQAEGSAPMTAAWSDQGIFDFTQSAPGAKSALTRAELVGKVKVDHPQMKLDSDSLELAFAPVAPSTTAPAALAAQPAELVPASQPVTPASTRPAIAMGQTGLKHLQAVGNVHCVMVGDKQQNQDIHCDNLAVATTMDNGRLVPQIINADGKVHAISPDWDLQSGHLEATVVSKGAVGKAGPSPAPATHPASTEPVMDLALQSLAAHENVVVVTKDATTATADDLLVNVKDGKTSLRLVGRPASVVDKQSTLTGPVIIIMPDDQQLSIPAAGELHAVQQESPGAATRPVVVVWSNRLHADGKTNNVDAQGNVVATTVDADGTVNHVQGDAVTLTLADATPSTMPTTRSATVSGVVAATVPATTPSADDRMSVMGHKTIRRAVFHDNAEIRSTLLGADGSLLRRMHMESQTIIYDVLPPAASTTGPAIAPAVASAGATRPAEAQLRRLTVPTPGRLLMEDFRPAAVAATQSGARSAQVDADAAVSARGSTAVKWARSMVYDDLSRQLVMEGDVKIVHQDNDKEEPLHLDADKVVADLISVAPTTQPAAPATQGTTRPSGEIKIQVRKVTASSNVRVISRGIEMTAASMEYDPLTHILTARGTENNPVVWSRIQATARGHEPMKAIELQWNTQTDATKIIKAYTGFP